MSKIMFSDRYGLETAVIELRKTKTRRMESANSKPYQIGEVVAVAQSYKRIYEELEEKKGNSKANEWWCDLFECIGDPTKHPGYRNKMFVREDFMLHYIKITGAKYERLQDITDEECLMEGVEKWLNCYIVTGILERGQNRNVCFDTPREAFAALIDRISGKGTWDSNPWVYAYEFELLH